MLLFFWLLLLQPYDLTICSLWVGQPPSWEQVRTYCPAYMQMHDNGDPEWDELYFQAVDVFTGAVQCTSAPAIPILLPECTPFPLDHYLLQIVHPDIQELMCTVILEHDGPPTDQEITDKCGQEALWYLQDGTYRMEYSGSRFDEEQVPEPICYPPALTEEQLSAPLATQEPYQYLAYMLHWYDLLDEGLLWQNRFDPSILRAATQTNVPPMILKKVIGKESQFWPLWTGEAGEVGLIQLTPEGADTALRHSPSLYAQYCPQVLSPERCAYGYNLLTLDEKTWLKNKLLDEMTIYGSPSSAILQVEVDMLNYAQVLAAFWCYTEEVLPLETPITWDLVLAAYHAGGSCIASGTPCALGEQYVTEVMR